MNCDQKNVTNKFGDKSNFRKPILVETFKKNTFGSNQKLFFTREKNWDWKIFCDKIILKFVLLCSIKIVWANQFSFVERKLDRIGPTDHISSTDLLHQFVICF